MALVNGIGKGFRRFGEYLEKRSTFDYSERPRNARRITTGGIANPQTGLGTPVDKSEASFFSPTRFYWRTPLEILYVQSPAARKFINIPVDDMFIKWRTWSGGSESALEKLEENEKRLKVKKALSQAMKSSRVYGSSVLCVMSKEAPMHEPLIPEEIREGDISCLKIWDRFDLSVTEREQDMYDENYGNPCSTESTRQLATAVVTGSIIA